MWRLPEPSPCQVLARKEVDLLGELFGAWLELLCCVCPAQHMEAVEVARLSHATLP